MAVLQFNKGLLAGKPIKKEIKFQDAETGEETKADIYVKQNGIAQVKSLMAMYNGGEGYDEERFAQMLAPSVVDEDGEPLFTAEQIQTFKSDLILEFIRVIGETSIPKSKAKKSAQKKNSSVS